MITKSISVATLDINNRELLVVVTGNDPRKEEFDRKMNRNSKEVLWAGIILFTAVLTLRYILL